MKTSLVALAEAVKEASRSPRVKKAAVELTDAAASRVRDLLEKRHKASARQTHMRTHTVINYQNRISFATGASKLSTSAGTPSLPIPPALPEAWREDKRMQRYELHPKLRR